jgi:hypothetical protein
MSSEIMVEFTGPTVQIAGKVTKTSGPYTAWGPGDMVLAPGPDDTLRDTNILSLSISDAEDPAGHPTFAIEGMQVDDDAAP